MKRTGDCYEAAVKFMLDHGTLGLFRERDDDLVLVHGEVSGQGDLAGIRFGHAWVERGETVIDRSNGKDIDWPRQVYYAIGNIDAEATHRYTTEEVRAKLLDSGTYGPWDLETSTGL